MDWKIHKKQLMKDPEFAQEWKKSQIEFQVAKAVITARIKKKLSQKELAERLSTRQSVISRVENAKTVPSLSFLKRLADALGVTLEVKLGI
jgi:ribosome-binding protein aMBF1 (putative translation factor)